MFTAGWVLLASGALLFAVGWVLNTQTPIQQPLPVIGAALGIVGILLLLAA